jgi:hypothetical protein
MQGAGVAGAAGLRPFLPTLVTGGLAVADVGVDFDGTEFAFLESPVFLVIIVLAAAATFALETRGNDLESGLFGSFYGGIALGLGALLCAASIDDRHSTWWYGLIIGAAVAYLASSVTRQLFARVRARFASANDAEAAAALPFYAEAAGLVVAGASILFPPLSLLALGFLIALLVTGRRRSDQKYAGLRILR